MTAAHDSEGQFGPHRFYPGEGSGGTEFRGGRFEVADLRGAQFTDCDLTGVTIRDGWLVNVSISGFLSNVTINGVDVTDFVSAELDRRHPERVQFREGQNADDVRAMWDTIERLWTGAVERAGRLPRGAVDEQVDEEWSFAQTLRHLVFITDAWASRTVLDDGPTIGSACRRAGIRRRMRPRSASTWRLSRPTPRSWPPALTGWPSCAAWWPT